MGTRGPLPTPANVRRLRSSGGARDAPPPLQPVRGIPEPPAWLSDEALAEWERITPELDRLGMVTHLDRSILAIYCDAWAKWVQSARLAGSVGLLATGQRGEDRKHPVMQLYRDLGTQCRNLARELGLTPSARLRIELPEAHLWGESDLLD